NGADGAGASAADGGSSALAAVRFGARGARGVTAPAQRWRAAAADGVGGGWRVRADARCRRPRRGSAAQGDRGAIRGTIVRAASSSSTAGGVGEHAGTERVGQDGRGRSRG